MVMILLDVTLTPMSSTNILSRPTGPRELLTMLAMDDAAMTAKQRRLLLATLKHLLYGHTCYNQYHI